MKIDYCKASHWWDFDLQDFEFLRCKKSQCSWIFNCRCSWASGDEVFIKKKSFLPWLQPIKFWPQVYVYRYRNPTDNTCKGAQGYVNWAIVEDLRGLSVVQYNPRYRAPKRSKNPSMSQICFRKPASYHTTTACYSLKLIYRSVWVRQANIRSARQ